MIRRTTIAFALTIPVLVLTAPKALTQSVQPARPLAIAIDPVDAGHTRVSLARVGGVTLLAGEAKAVSISYQLDSSLVLELAGPGHLTTPERTYENFFKATFRSQEGGKYTLVEVLPQ